MNELEIKDLQIGDFLHHKDNASMVAKVDGFYSAGVIVNLYIGHTLYSKQKKLMCDELHKWNLLGQNTIKRSR